MRHLFHTVRPHVFLLLDVANFSIGCPLYFVFIGTKHSASLTLTAVILICIHFLIIQLSILRQEFHMLYWTPSSYYKLTKSDCHLPKSPKWAASMWLGCFLSVAVLLLEKESMLAEMALIAIWLGPAASSKAWFLVLFCGEYTGFEAIIFQKIVKIKIW